MASMSKWLPPGTSKGGQMPSKTPVAGSYGRDHRARRERMRRAILAAERGGQPLLCPRCDQPILTSDAFDAGHTVEVDAVATSVADRPEHASCNRSAGATYGNEKRAGKVRKTSREW